jgi:alginate O-acetyltransferase complex protein AlgI
MNFASLTFLLFFLPPVLVTVFSVPRDWRNSVLLWASLLFFAWGAPKFVLPLVAGCLFDHILVRSYRGGGTPADARHDNWLCGIGVAANILALGWFKYAGFAIDQANAALAAAGFSVALPVVRVALPLGISFFTFQKISYLVDVRRGAAAPAPTFRRYLLYIMLFPQLVMGPIIRYREIADQFGERSVSAEDFLQGLWRFAVGLARKMLLAGPLGSLSAAAFAVTDGGGLLPAPSAWLGLYAYTLQIYFDFAGYCDMAVGIGRMLGFRFPENFDAPYISRDMGEFWRRWHITLGAFMREYLYIPLGGNRCSRGRSFLNHWIVFLVSGIWHGASWNFVAWGAWHGLWIVLGKAFRRGGAARDGRWCLADIPTALWTFLMVMLGWVFFASAGFGGAAAFLRSLAGCGGAGAAALPPPTPQAVAALAVGTVLSFLPAVFPKLGLAEWRTGPGAPAAAVWARTVATALLLVLASLPLLTSGFAPFIYNRF